jgi:type II secretory pathway pseudopilin PulG
VEILVVLAMLGIVALQAAPGFVAWRQRQRLDAAVREAGLQLGRACALAAASGRTHAVQFEAGGNDLGWVLVADGDGDGVSAADVAAGVDAPIDAAVRLSVAFPGVTPGRPAGVPTVAGGAADTHGLAFGGAGTVSCSAEGGARSGTLYLSAAGRQAAALRVYGPTARLSLWWWESPPGAWLRLR